MAALAVPRSGGCAAGFGGCLPPAALAAVAGGPSATTAARLGAGRRLARAFLSAAPSGRGRTPLCCGGVVWPSALERV